MTIRVLAADGTVKGQHLGRVAGLNRRAIGVDRPGAVRGNRMHDCARAAQSEPVMRQRLAPNPDVTIRTFPQLNHLMQPATSGRVDEYARIGTTISPVVLDTVTQWLRRRY